MSDKPQLLLALLLLTLGAINAEVSENICLPDLPCQCHTTSSGLRATCRPDALEPTKLNFSLLPTETTNLSVVCTSGQPGLLQDRPFRDLSLLLELRITNCTLSDIPSGTFTGLSNIKLIHITGLRQIHRITNQTFAGVNNLESVDLSHNGILDIESGAFENVSVNSLALTNNYITEYPLAINFIQGLQVLDLSHNGIRLIPSRHVMPTYDSLNAISLGDNNITYVPRLAFSWAYNLLVLDLRFNQIDTIEYAAFEGVASLRRLFLPGNDINDLTLILNPLTRLTHLSLAGNNLVTLRQEWLPASLIDIDLSFNFIRTWPFSLFSDMDDLQTINLKYNGIRTLYEMMIAVSHRVRYHPKIYLKGNVFDCDCHLNWLSRHMGSPSPPIRYAILADIGSVHCAPNSIIDVAGRTVDSANMGVSSVISVSPTLEEVDPSKFLCAYTEDCDPTCSCCHYCHDSCRCYRTDDRNVNIIDCQLSNLTSIPTRLHPGTTALHLDGNSIQDLGNMAFQNSTYIEKLYLNYSNIINIHKRTFHGLRFLKLLYLQDNDIMCLQSGIFHNLMYLQKLMIQNNMIHFVANDTFTNLDSLDILYLHGNQLQTLPDDVYNVSSQLSKLTLAGNPWSCDCLYGPDFQSWVQSESGLIEDISGMWCYSNPSRPVDYDGRTLVSTVSSVIVSTTHSEFVCGWPGEIGNRTTLLLETDFSFCVDNSTIIQRENKAHRKLRNSLLSLGIISFVVLIITLIMYNTRELAQVWLFKRYGLRFHKPTEDENKQFDAFVSYSHKDEPFVMNVLAPNLEEIEPKYKLLLHYRDWLVGGSIADSILDSVDNSKRMILVLTDNYVKSEWCHYEFKMAHHNVITEGKNRIIVILLSDDLPKNMGSDLKLYTKTTTYLRYDDPWFWDKLRLAMPDKGTKADKEQIGIIQREDTKPLNVDIKPQNARQYIGDVRNK